ncbi:MAG: hypothetical protein LBT33_08175 [Spirochaetia bacterium]|nr:hypothetical protein [Spirochaetia bacterium]
MIAASSIKNKVLVVIQGNALYRLERLKKGDPEWLLWTAAGFAAKNPGTEPQAVGPGDFLDNHGIENGLYTYRIADMTAENPEEDDYQHANWVRCGETGPVGYSFGNYSPAPGTWGEAVTPDDFRYTYLWGTDFKATNGSLFTDGQVRFFIDAAVADIERRLNITIKKKRVRCMPDNRGLKKGVDYDVEEAYYDFKFHKIQRYGMITTRQRPIISLHRLKMISRFSEVQDLLDTTVVDKTKGVLKLLRRPVRPSETARGIQTSASMFGTETLTSYLFYEVDYDAGYGTSDDIPADLREAIAKNTAISLLNVIGDGLMSGFSSSSLSMDGISESFSSTQSATSAYFGARIKVYEEELNGYIEQAKRKFGHMVIGAI